MRRDGVAGEGGEAAAGGVVTGLTTVEEERGSLTDAQLKTIKQAGAQKVDYVERMLGDLSREMALLQNFAILNYTGFVKILKKHDKVGG